MSDREFDGSGITDLLKEVVTDLSIVDFKDLIIKDALVKALEALGDDLDAGDYASTKVADFAYETLDDLYMELDSDEDDEDELEEDDDDDDDEEK